MKTARAIVLFFIAGIASTEASTVDPAAEMTGPELSIVIPRAADRPDRTGKWQQKDEKYSPNKRTAIAAVFEPDITYAVERGIKTYDPSNAENTWIIASSYEASQILNDYTKISALLSGKDNYTLILLNPNETLLNFDGLKNISDPNLIVVEIEKDYDAPYSEFLERFKPQHNQEIVDWVRGKNMHQSDKDWRFLTEVELYKIGRVATDTLGPKSLPQHKNNTFGPNDLTIEKILAELDFIDTNGPKKEVSDRIRMVIPVPPDASRASFFNGWKDEEIIAYMDHIAKWTANIASPYMTYISWGDVLKEVMNMDTPLPESHSNRKKWEEKGLRVLDQHVIKGNTCIHFAWGHAIHAAMIEAGQDKDAINGYEWARMALAEVNDSESSSRRVRNGRRYWDFGSGWGKTAKVMHDYGFEDMLLKGVPLKSGKRYRPEQIIIRDIKNFNFMPGTYTWWLKQRVAPEINMPEINFQLRTTNVREGRYYNHKFELETGYRDAMMKKEISSGRPVLLGGRLPYYWKEDGNAVKTRGNIVQRAWKDSPRGINYYTNNGRHAIIIVGYKPDPLDSRRTLYECLNSYGPGWGDGGYFWLGSEWLDYFNFDHWMRIASLSFE